MPQSKTEKRIGAQNRAISLLNSLYLVEDKNTVYKVTKNKKTVITVQQRIDSLKRELEILKSKF